MKKQKWQASKEGFGDGWVRYVLASSHPVYLEVRLNVFTNELTYVITKDKQRIFADNNFNRALGRFNEAIEQETP